MPRGAAILSIPRQLPRPQVITNFLIHFNSKEIELHSLKIQNFFRKNPLKLENL